MTHDEIIRFAIQCHLVTTGNRDGLYMDALMEFAQLVAVKQREECAKICDEYSATGKIEEFDRGWLACAKNAANAIRARKQA